MKFSPVDEQTYYRGLAHAALSAIKHRAYGTAAQLLTMGLAYFKQHGDSPRRNALVTARIKLDFMDVLVDSDEEFNDVAYQDALEKAISNLLRSEKPDKGEV